MTTDTKVCPSCKTMRSCAEYEVPFRNGVTRSHSVCNECRFARTNQRRTASLHVKRQLVADRHIEAGHAAQHACPKCRQVYDLRDFVDAKYKLDLRVCCYCHAKHRRETEWKGSRQNRKTNGCYSHNFLGIAEKHLFPGTSYEFMNGEQRDQCYILARWRWLGAGWTSLFKVDVLNERRRLIRWANDIGGPPLPLLLAPYDRHDPDTGYSGALLGRSPDGTPCLPYRPTTDADRRALAVLLGEDPPALPERRSDERDRSDTRVVGTVGRDTFDVRRWVQNAVL